MIVVTGYAGQLGYDVVQELHKRNIECVGADKSDFDITDPVATERFIRSVMPNAVVHCSAYTAVDGAEENVELCRAVNVEGTANIARVCKAIGAKMLYISTDYVFSGLGRTDEGGGMKEALCTAPSSPSGSSSHGDEEGRFYETTDPTGPCNVYGQSKLDGERVLKEILERYFIVRTSWVFGHHGKNFVETMLQLGQEKSIINVVNDQVGSPTFTEDLVRLIGDMILTEKYGTYHATNEGICSWAELAAEIMRLAGLPCKINPISTAEYLASTNAPSSLSTSESISSKSGNGSMPHSLRFTPCVLRPKIARRPLNSRLSKKSLDEAGFQRLPSWQDALKRYLNVK